MTETLRMGGGDAQTDYPELDPDNPNGRVDDPDADPNLTDDEERGVPAADPESGA
ncbi:hypothetical protein G7009_20740 [Pseudomonas capeferrum]|uniref:hypothetical protein n=1 Tax=Pseudomonas capeferrum TaxID=1495066 RepID=UPI0015E3D3D2|nr:hypothetical protein [Pseudomonas capeferrum]MBA1204151.1 hypothetical protein [Pseudomonas capeferrum]